MNPVAPPTQRIYTFAEVKAVPEPIPMQLFELGVPSIVPFEALYVCQPPYVPPLTPASVVHVRPCSAAAPTTLKVPPTVVFPVAFKEPVTVEFPVIVAPPPDTVKALVTFNDPATVLLPVIAAPRLVTVKPPVMVAPLVAFRIAAATNPVTAIDPVRFTPLGET